jgi:hypothetical protein
MGARGITPPGGRSSSTGFRASRWRSSCRSTSGRSGRRSAAKAAEWGLVCLLAAHLAGGLRLLALECLPWRDWQKSLLAVAAGLTIVVGLALALAL